MKALNLTLLIIVILVIAFSYFWKNDFFKERTFDQKRQDIVSQIDKGLAKAIQKGDYKCCITPPCKMCYLGEWIWDDGRCDCDTEIAIGNWDNVCPECKKGVEQGRCSSTINPGTCIVN